MPNTPKHDTVIDAYPTDYYLLEYDAHGDSLQTIPKDVLHRRPLGRLTSDELPVLDRALRHALGILS